MAKKNFLQKLIYNLKGASLKTLLIFGAVVVAVSLGSYAFVNAKQVPISPGAWPMPYIGIANAAPAVGGAWNMTPVQGQAPVTTFVCQACGLQAG